HCKERRERKRPKRRSSLKQGLSPPFNAPPPPPVIARSGRKVGTRRSAACCRHATRPDSRALRKRRGNPEDFSPTPLPRVIPPLCHSERSEESYSSINPRV